MAVELARPVLNVGIVTTDLERMMAFYGGVLGFTPLEPIVFPGAGTVQRMQVGDCILRLFAVEQTPPHEAHNESHMSAPGYRYLTLPVVDIEAAFAAFREFGATIPREPRELRPGVFSGHVQDPDGNWIEVMQGS